MHDTTKIELASKSLDNLVDILSTPKPTPSLWLTYGLPILTVALGAGLTLLIQWVIEGKKNKRTDKVSKRQLIAKAKAKIFLISRLLNTLAMYRVHKQYYGRAATISQDKSDSDDSWKKHYEKGQETRVTEAKFDTAISEYIEIVIEYMQLSKSKSDIEPELKTIYEYSFEKSSDFANCKTIADCISTNKSEEARLREEYKKYLTVLDNLINKASG
ncbi:MAG: hypothetical protein C0448_15565 [Sphingobacteriaceae bacterium]|nr:hypothetical protein [Sphingobacteriaceae bacterium]